MSQTMRSRAKHEVAKSARRRIATGRCTARFTSIWRPHVVQGLVDVVRGRWMPAFGSDRAVKRVLVSPPIRPALIPVGPVPILAGIVGHTAGGERFRQDIPVPARLVGKSLHCERKAPVIPWRK